MQYLRRSVLPLPCLALPLLVIAFQNRLISLKDRIYNLLLIETFEAMKKHLKEMTVEAVCAAEWGRRLAFTSHTYRAFAFPFPGSAEALALTPTSPGVPRCPLSRPQTASFALSWLGHSWSPVRWGWFLRFKIQCYLRVKKEKSGLRRTKGTRREP